jgi:hypothetical protein
MKKKLIIISDLWGKEKAEWLTNYTEILKIAFNITYYDSCELGNIDKTVYNEDDLHKRFVSGGIEKAVNKLIKLEKHPIHILAFSIGGTIAWKYGMISKNIISLTCISSTRLRKETKKTEGKLFLYFGENDKFKPQKNWFESLKIDYIILPNKEHLMYCEPNFAEQLSKKMIKL